MSWESTALYYQVINREVSRRYGGLHSAKIILLSLDFEEIAARQRAGAWTEMSQILCGSAKRLHQAGAECILICTNTMHRLADDVRAAVDIPLMHIAEVAALEILKSGINRIALLGTRFTMEQDFYKAVLAAHGVESVIPTQEGRDEVHRIIFEELCQGIVSDASLKRLQMIASEMIERGAQGVVLGCTELPLILNASHFDVPVFDTTTLHALSAVDFSCG